MTTCFQLVLRGMVEGIEAVRRGGECLDGGVREPWFDHTIIKLIKHCLICVLNSMKHWPEWNM